MAQDLLSGKHQPRHVNTKSKDNVLDSKLERIAWDDKAALFLNVFYAKWPAVRALLPNASRTQIMYEESLTEHDDVMSVLDAALGRNMPMDILKVLIWKGNLDITPNQLRDVLAVQHDDNEYMVELVQFILSTGTDPNSFIKSKKNDHCRVTCMHIACVRPTSLPVMQALLMHGGRLDLRNGQYDITPLGYAAKNKTMGIEMFSLMLQHDGARNAINLKIGKEGWTPFHAILQVHSHDVALIRLFLDNGASPNLVASNELAPLFLAMARKAPDAVMKLLLDYGADPNIKFGDHSALQFAMEKGCSGAILQFMVEKIYAPTYDKVIILAGTTQ